MVKKDFVLLLVGVFLIVMGIFIFFGFGAKISGHFILGNPVSGDITSYVSRSFQGPEYYPGIEMKVTLMSIISSGDKIVNYGVEEYIPLGWNVNISSISNSGYYNSNLRRISWIINSSSHTNYLSSINLSYVVTPVSATGTQTFIGNSSFTDIYSNVFTFNTTSVLGDSVVREGLIQVEDYNLFISHLYDASGFSSGDKMSGRIKVLSPTNINYDCIANFTYASPTTYSGNCTSMISASSGTVVSIKAYNHGYGSINANVSSMGICDSTSIDQSGLICNITINGDKYVNTTFKIVNKISCSPPALSIVNNQNGNYVLSWQSQIDCGYVVQTTSSIISPFTNYTNPLYNSVGGIMEQPVVGLGVSQYFRLLVIPCKSGTCAPAPIPSLSLSISPSLTVYEGTTTLVNGTGCPSGLSCYLINGSDYIISNPDVSNLAVGTYDYVYSTNGNSAYSSANVKKTINVIPAPVLPIAPSNLSVKNNGNLALRLDWKDNSNNEAGFVIQRTTSLSSPFVEIARVSANVNYYVNSGLRDKQIYYYRIYAYNADGSSSYSSTASGTAYKCVTLKKLFGFC